MKRQGVPCDENNAVCERTAGAYQSAIEGPPVEVRHFQVADHQVELLPAEAVEALAAVQYCVHQVTLSSKDVGDQLRYSGLVLDHQDTPAMRRGRAVGFGGHYCESRRGGRNLALTRLRSHGRYNGKLHKERGAASGLALDRNLAAMLLHDPVHDGKAQAGAHADRLGGEERIEDARSNLGRDAGAVIGHFERQPLLRDALRAHPDVAVPASLLDGLFGVDHQVEHHLLHLEGIGERGGQLGIELEIDGDVFNLQFVAAQRQSPLDDLVQVHWAALRLRFTAEQEQVLDDPAGPLGFLEDHAGVGCAFEPRLATQQQLRVAHDAGQRVVQLVRDARDQFPQRRHFFRLEQLRLDQPLVGDVAVHLEPADSLALGV